MPNAVAAIGETHDHIHHSAVPSEHHWLTDPQQLANWQDELVDCCRAINVQLSQIQNELAVETPSGTERAFRVVS